MSNLIERYNPFDPVYGDDLNHIIDIIDGMRYNLVNVATGPSNARYVIDTTSIRAYDNTVTNYGAPSGAGVTFEVSPSGQVFIGGGSLTLQNSSSGSRWIIDPTSIRGYDGTANNYGAPSGAGVIFEAGNATGKLFVGGSFTIQSANSGARLVEDATSFRLYDGTVTNYGAPSGAGVTFEAKNDGSVFASKLKLQSSPSGSYILMNAQGAATAGVSPYLSINDGTRDRVQFGNLASYTDPSGFSSAAGYGGRALDSSGNLLWDTNGISQTMKRISSNSFGAGNINVNATTAFVVPFSPINYVLSRQQTVLIIGTMTASWNGPTNAQALVGLEPQTGGTGGGGGVPNPIGMVPGSSPITNITLWQVRTLAAGTYTAGFLMQTGSTGTTFSSFGGQIDVFLLGG